MGCLLQKPPKFHNFVFFFISPTTLGNFIILIGLFIKLSGQTFQPIIVQKCSFCELSWGMYIILLVIALSLWILEWKYSTYSKVYILTNSIKFYREKIILKKKVKIYKNDSVRTLSKRILKQEHKLYPAAIKKLFS